MNSSGSESSPAVAAAAAASSSSNHSSNSVPRGLSASSKWAKIMTLQEAMGDQGEGTMTLKATTNGRPRLFYFHARGRAEIIRLIFAQAEVEYDDVRFREPPHAMEDFERLKGEGELPFDQVPILEVDGMVLAQSQAIVRYIARKHGLMGGTELDNAFADMVACGTEDLRQKFTQMIFAKTEQEREQQLQTFSKEVLPRWARYFENLLCQRGGDWFLGSRLTYADLAVYDMMSTITWRLPEAFGPFESLRAHGARVEKLPNIAHWLQTRPDNPL
ncbi:unnamed protein product [Vitrella brassicaformis CCMP3155]|uniref:Glutathione transferase n=1 Tax=Vitrella brassicaformis (strain CCMP3155) TaxID=1169540 RepID=A0A0G4EJB2_VITBC|nr:unnamed protein product [Vitrella brassicaformis CCMP3155]|eukprot:CEL96819.1 unnamed protein product [Vitrella brassicaformis CCMP3155]